MSLHRMTMIKAYTQGPRPSVFNPFDEEHFINIAMKISFQLMPLNSGHVRFTVTPNHVGLDYVRACLLADETATHNNGEIASHCDIAIDGTRHDSTSSTNASISAHSL